MFETCIKVCRECRSENRVKISGTTWVPQSVLFPRAGSCRGEKKKQSSAHNTSNVILVLRNALGRSSLSRDSRAVREIPAPLGSELVPSSDDVRHLCRPTVLR